MDPISRTNASTPISSPGLFSPAAALHHRHPKSQNATPSGSPLLHPLQMHRVRETHEALIEKDFITGRKLINQYEIIDEIGRGQHGKVKLARSLETGVYVAIKIIQRFSKTRRLGKVTTSPETKTKREIAILKKIRHENVVGLLEVIDDPELKKIYMVLEHVAFGEIQWRKKGVPSICAFERRRIERDIRGELDIGESEKYFRQEERRRRRHEAQRRKLAQVQQHADHWSNEHGNDDEDDGHPLSRQSTDDFTALTQVRSHTSIMRSNPGSRVPSAAPSANSSRAHTPLPIETDIGPLDSDNEDDANAPLSSTHSKNNRDSIHESVFGSYQEDGAFRGRSPSMADSIISHMSSNDGYHDPFEDDFSYVPCFTFRQARAAFRDTVLGLEYLHYEGIVHRDIKPANLLWTKSGHVKISDFGVSYFGRPIRDGEPEENVSESDARDFDNDLELAKTVGTPAFFAPELCFTDLNIPQPKVSEQIDVWSLGVTLYCLIYARIPFLAEDEWQLFRAIAQEEVHIPRRRLKPVDAKCKFEDADEPAEDPSNFRDEHELELEDIDDELYDLLRRMMIKDPAERIKLREVKRHPWVIRGIPDVLGWLDDTDPSRAHAGRRIQVDDRELERAVVPITFLERARSAVKKAVGKVIGATRGDRSEGSRKRATSSVGSSSGEVSQVHTPLALTPTTYASTTRRPSLKGEDTYFSPNQYAWEQQHPLSQSVTVSPDERTGKEDSFDQSFTQLSFTAGPQGYQLSMASDETRPGLPERTVSAAASIQTVVHRGHGRSGSVTIPASTGVLPDTETLSDAYYNGHDGGGTRYCRRGSSDEGLTRARSVDRVLFTSDDKHGEASIAISTAVAPGAFQRSRPSQESLISKSFDSSPSHLEHYGNHSQYFFTPYMIATHQNLHMQPSHNPHNSTDQFQIDTIPEERPSTATQKSSNAKTPAPRVYRTSTPESFAKAQVQLARRHQLEIEADRRKHDATTLATETISESECPPSPDDDLYMGRENDHRQKSSSSINSSGILSPISTFDVASPTSSVDLDSSNGQPIASDQSLPQLVSTSTSSSASYISKPSLVDPSGSEQTPKTTTPTTLTKQNSVEDDTPTAMSISSYFTDDDAGYIGDQDLAVVADDSDDSDEGLTMGRRKGNKFMLGQGGVGRRGTNASVGSTETAKKVPMNG